MPITRDADTLLELEPDPMGPVTLRQQVRISDSAVRVMERMRYGNSFIPSGAIERIRSNQGNLRARMEHLLEAHPELVGMYALHEQLLDEYYAKEKAGADVTALQSKCRELADHIVALEKSVDLG